MADEFDDEPLRPAPAPPAPNAEGVRIIGADEARAAIEGGQVQRRRVDTPRPTEAPASQATPDPTRTVRFPLPDEVISVEAEVVDDHDDVEPVREIVLEPEAAEEVREPVVRIVTGPSASDEPSGPVQLPHWSEPPTGEMARIVAAPETGYDEGGDDLDAWAAIGGSSPRFRDDSQDWGDEDVALTGELKAVAISTPEPMVDDDEAFDREVAARRRRRRTTRAMTASDADHNDRSTTPPPAGRDLPIAIATGVGIAAVAVAAMLLGPPWVLALAVIIIGLAAVELFEGFRRAEFQPATLLGILGAVTLVIAAYHRGLAAYPLVTVLVIFFSMLWYLTEVVRARPVSNIGVTLLGFGYIGIFGSFAGMILALPWSVAATELDSNRDGIGIILGLAICAVGSDIVGYFVGSRLGRRKIAPRISPNKTVEGLIGSAVASVLLAVLIVQFFEPWSFGDALALGLVVAVMAPLGDFIESMLKRDLGVKDLGTILPGHGGVLDRFDAILVCLPAVYYLARALFG